MFKSPAFKKVLFVFLTVRIAFSLLSYLVATTATPFQPIPAEGYQKPAYSPLLENTAGIWERSDTLWFLHIARDGYTGNHDAAFMPLYPLLIRFVQTITFLPWILCALLVSNLALLFALYFLYLLTELDHGPTVAIRSVWNQALIPGAVFLFAAYTEPLYLLLVLGSLYFCRKEQWLYASLFASLLCLTRNVGILILAAFAVEMVQSYREKRMISFKKTAWLLLVPLTFGLYLTYWYYKTGDFFRWIHAQDGWGREGKLPWMTVLEGFSQAFQFGRSNPGGYYVLEAMLLAVVLSLSIWGIKKIRFSYTVFTLLSLLPPLCAPFQGRMLMSFTRFLAVIFPTSILLALIREKEEWDLATKIVLTTLATTVGFLFFTSLNMF